MTNWAAIADARGLRASAEEVQRMAEVLTALELAFAPLVAEIPIETEPAAVFRVSAQ
jgi:hypothetical protein